MISRLSILVSYAFAGVMLLRLAGVSFKFHADTYVCATKSHPMG
jgi:hypothetical protein